MYMCLFSRGGIALLVVFILTLSACGSRRQSILSTDKHAVETYEHRDVLMQSVQSDSTRWESGEYEIIELESMPTSEVGKPSRWIKRIERRRSGVRSASEAKTTNHRVQADSATRHIDMITRAKRESQYGYGGYGYLLIFTLGGAVVLYIAYRFKQKKV